MSVHRVPGKDAVFVRLLAAWLKLSKEHRETVAHIAENFAARGDADGTGAPSSQDNKTEGVD